MKPTPILTALIAGLLLLTACGPTTNDVLIAQADRDGRIATSNGVIAQAQSAADIANANAVGQVAQAGADIAASNNFWHNLPTVLFIIVGGILAILLAIEISRHFGNWLRHRQRVEEIMILGYLPPPPAQPFIPITTMPHRREIQDSRNMPDPHQNAVTIWQQPLPPARRIDRAEYERREAARRSIFGLE